MPYSPTLNAETSTPMRLCAALQNWELSVSSHARIMLMAELIYILLSISGESFEREELILSMLEVITLTSHHHTAHLKKVMTTRSKMVMLSEGGLKDQAELQFQRLLISGLKSSWRRVETSFFLSLVHLLHELCVPPSPAFQSMPIGNIAWIQSRIDTTHSLVSILLEHQNCLSGHMTLLMRLEE
ncbi:putative ORF3 protein [Cattle blood-associated gemycircularvirus]|uniref:Putative ORF3 protein n=2 Tax=Genomoviridae TaxID=1910928 RepID=A0A2L0HHX2_9VIRU|nr:putative ORF3 protein [Cattle blood-associated gemycircularvirus]AUX80749.1 putative ORF3 protein [Cattle blood-associated gemycircularvirus]